MNCDAAKFAGMYEKVYKDLYRYALCVMKNPQDAEDAVSEAVVRGYEHVFSLRSEEAFQSWIFTILSNVCKKKLASMAKQRPEETSFFTAGSEERIEEDVALSMDIRRAFMVLSEEEQIIVGLSVFGGYQSKEIGKMLKLKAGTVRSKRSRALEKMSVVLTAGSESSQATYKY